MSRWVKVSTIGLIVGMSLSAWTGEQAGVGLLLATVAGIIGQSVFPDRMRIGYTITFLLALMVGMFSYARTFEHWQSLPETFQFSGPVEIRERGEAKVFYRPVTLRPLSDDWSSGEVLYHAPIDFSIQPGERLSFSCSLIRPRNFEPGFDYRNLLASRGTGYTCERGGKWEVLDSDDFSLQGMLAAEQARLQEAISNLIPEPESGLLIGLLIGGGDNLAPETKSAFARAGLSHIVAVSGYNMSVVAEGLVLLALITGLWRRWAVSVAVVGLVFFL
ncbi:MAG: ComEC/Rec2 family competence protein, partial [Undibacterium sp.]